MTVHLFRFGYTWPKALEVVDANPNADLGEASSCVFVTGMTESLAIHLGEMIAEAYVQARYGQDAYSWQALGFASWLETDVEIISWASDHGVPVCRSDCDVPNVVREMIRSEDTSSA